MRQKKVVYIAGPITGVDRYWEAFEQAEEDLLGRGYTPLSPAHLPTGLTNAQYTRIDFAMIDCADAVLFLPGWKASEGASLEHAYCEYNSKPVVFLRTQNHNGHKLSREEVQAWLNQDLERVLK